MLVCHGAGQSGDGCTTIISYLLCKQTQKTALVRALITVSFQTRQFEMKNNCLRGTRLY